MHTVETAVVIPLILMILLGGILLSLGTLSVIDGQTKRYARETDLDAASCVQVLRITEVIYETLEEIDEQ